MADRHRPSPTITSELLDTVTKMNLLATELIQEHLDTCDELRRERNARIDAERRLAVHRKTTSHHILSDMPRPNTPDDMLEA
jgi:hypothetical protein